MADVRDILIVDADFLPESDAGPSNLAQSSLSQKGQIDFVIDIPQGLELDVDSEQIFRVVHNLCRNAVQALSADEDDDLAVIKRITVSAALTNGTAIIEIDDTGPGMPARAREHLFTAFHGSARSGGTGLGLAIAHELVHAHGGTIALVDNPGSGTRFRITLPNQPAMAECLPGKRPVLIKQAGA